MGDAGTDRLDRPGIVLPEDERLAMLEERGEDTGPDRDIDRIGARRPDADQDLAVADRRLGQVDDGSRRVEVGEGVGAHDLSLE